MVHGRGGFLPGRLWGRNPPSAVQTRLSRVNGADHSSLRALSQKRHQEQNKHNRTISLKSDYFIIIHLITENKISCTNYESLP